MLAEQLLAPSPLPDTVFAKTDKGRSEIAQRTNGLDRRQRSLLIMLDGQKPKQALAAMFPGEPVDTILHELLALALVAPVNLPAVTDPLSATSTSTYAPPPASVMQTAARPATAGSAAPPAPAVRPAPPAAPAVPVDAERLAEVKAMLIESARNCLGLLAADVVRKVEGAGDGDQLLRCIGHWHMAMQASKRGKDVAEAQLEHIKRSLRTAVA